MEILFLLVPMSVVLALAIIGLFAWALQSGQMDDVEGEGGRILLDDEDRDGIVGAAAAALDADQARDAARPEQWRGPSPSPLR